MDLGLQGKRAAVAGSTSGLGFATAMTLANEGVRVAINGRFPERVDAAVARITERGGNAVGLPIDVGSMTGGQLFVEQATDALGGLDILVPNCGGPPAGTFASTDPDSYLTALHLNLLSVIGMCQAAVPLLTSQRWGRIVAITSIAVRQPVPTLILSNTARAGVWGFLKTLALEIAGDGVTVNSVLPGLHATDRLTALRGADPGTGPGGEPGGPGGAASKLTDGIPTKTIGRPEDLASAVTFLCSDQARYITGTALPIAGGVDRSLL